MRHIREKRSGQVGKTVNADVTLAKGENPPADNALPRHQKVAERGKDFRKSKVPRHSPVSLSTTIVSAWHLSYKLANQASTWYEFSDHKRALLTTNLLYVTKLLLQSFNLLSSQVCGRRDLIYRDSQGQQRLGNLLYTLSLSPWPAALRALPISFRQCRYSFRY